MGLPTSLVFVHKGTNGSIPSGWTRETALDGVYPYVASGDTAGTTGGAATHAHDITTGAHSFSGGSGSGDDLDATAGSTGATAVTSGHTHGSATSNTSTVGSGTATNNPVHVDVIFIKPNDSSRAGVPASCWALSDSSVFTGWSLPTEPKGVFLRGAAASGDSSLTHSGSATHTHTGSHSHAAKTSGARSGGTTGKIPAGTGDAVSTHTHQVTLNANDPGMSTDNGDPTWQKLCVVQNDTGAESLPDGVIAFYLGTVANIPADWAQFTFGAGYDFLMGASSTGEIGNTGGATAHGHTANAHTDGSHGVTQGNASALTGDNAAEDYNWAAADHAHTWTLGSATDTVANCSTRANYPAYKHVLLLKYTAPSTNIAGTAAGAGSASGTVTGRAAVAGSSGGLGSASCAVTGQAAVAGSAAGIATASGSITGDGAVAGSAAGLTTPTGTISGSGAIAGSGAGLATVSGTVAGRAAVAGESAGIGSATGTVTGPSGHAISGSAAGTSTATGHVTGVGRIEGAAAGLGRATGRVTNLVLIPDPMARHSATRSVSAFHRASRACPAVDFRVCGPRRES